MGRIRTDPYNPKAEREKMVMTTGTKITREIA